ncbi:FAD/NAD(P)-binding protein [Actinacidiphila paucisporea]|uniref:FAD-NAD(P)-binding n=1 Tax=Actinacidiphila paucisporea TaxID=310782 RepID=A0A1M7FN98_9ACTN|nr:FAD/NAD(P)-binding protein [Actinacidiphila paucisporea]SHM05476.1 FAD-NAD(P)-binding [Actinacidiphila paucisporea]
MADKASTADMAGAATAVRTAEAAVTTGSPTPTGADGPAPFTVVVVGAGPAGTSLLERICANIPELVPDRPVRVHLVDPHPHGGGRVWRQEQSALMWANTPMAAITVFPDENMACEGPKPPGPAILDWARTAAPEDLADPVVADEVARAHPRFYPSRRTLAAYLSSVVRRLVAGAPSNVEVVTHADTAVELVDDAHRTTVRLESGAELVADAVLLAQGHHDVEPAPPALELARFAAEHGLTYLSAQYAADADLDVLRPGEPVIVRGLALSFVDYVVLLTEARGGSWTRDADGTLQYVPSGREPVLYAGSRRGVPYRSKLGYNQLLGEKPTPHFLTAQVAKELIARPEPVDFGLDIRPLIHAEMELAHYQELFTGHPDRVTRPWQEVAEVFELLGSGLPADRARVDAVVADCVPDPADRFDLPALQYPLEGVRVDSPDRLHELILDHVTADLARRGDQRYSQDLAAIQALMNSMGPIFQLLSSNRLSARSRTKELDPWFHDFFGYIGSGPPGPRAEQLLALGRAGVVRFLGGGLEIVPDAARGVFVARGVNAPVEVAATALLEARLPTASVVRNRDALVRRLYERGACTEEQLRDAPGQPAFSSGKLAVHATDQRVLAADGSAHPRLFAVGAWTAGFGPAGFPRLNPIGFMRCDAMVRSMLRLGAAVPSLGSAAPDTPPQAG